MENKPTALVLKNEQDLKVILAGQYMKQIRAFFGDNEKALEFCTNVVASTQRVPKLLECTPDSLMNSFMTMASLKLMPSGVSGEAYVLPYENKKKGVCEAQFQLGYQGLVTLLYRAGARSIVAEIVREKDQFSYENGEVKHVPDVFAERGKPRGAYVIIELQNGSKIAKVMSEKEILNIAQSFSKSYGGDFGPWNEKQDPEKWMWRKTVLKQAAKLVPKNETVYRALAEDNKDSILSGREKGIELSSTAPVDFDAHKAELEACKTKEDLERVWADMPAVVRPQLKGTMESVRAMIMSEVKDIV